MVAVAITFGDGAPIASCSARLGLTICPVAATAAGLATALAIAACLSASPARIAATVTAAWRSAIIATPVGSTPRASALAMPVVMMTVQGVDQGG